MSEKISSIDRLINNCEDHITRVEQETYSTEQATKSQIEAEFYQKLQDLNARLQVETPLLADARSNFEQWKKIFMDKTKIVNSLKKQLANIEKNKVKTLRSRIRSITSDRRKKIKDLEKKIKGLRKQKTKIQKEMDQGFSQS
ncbi:MAG: hypothetical protein JW891_11915 [Candidatus Lokiarchaeota archaeon]|nr:hypothetical protein [Candidatus Lokiarchaeota archaeon]